MPIPPTMTDQMLAETGPQELPQASDPTNDFMTMLIQMIESKGLDMDAIMSGQVQLNDVLSPEEMNQIMSMIQRLPLEVQQMLQQAMGQM